MASTDLPSLMVRNSIRDLLEEGHLTGPLVHDVRIAALCTHYGVRELWMTDRDFGRFPGLKARNPLVG